ncbi:MAG TPA: hypothetical protein VGO22_19630 [Pseudorhizobium sp.]|nr:hypothetical protein [Pseudorhizobium sp.]
MTLSMADMAKRIEELEARVKALETGQQQTKRAIGTVVSRGGGQTPLTKR